MPKNRLFKIFFWLMTIFFFFLAAGVIISIFRPGPSAAEVMQFMAGMMSAMDTSMMGVAMNIKHDPVLQSIITLSASITVPIMLISVIIGLLIRFVPQGAKHGE